MKKLLLTTTPDHRGMRLDRVLAEWLPKALARPISKSRVRAMIMAGAVCVNGRRVRSAAIQIMPESRIEAQVDIERLQGAGPARDRAFALKPEHVLYEDEWLIAIAKPPGLPSQPTVDEARENLFAIVTRFLGRRIGVHQRLDRDTSGVVVFTKAKEADAGLAEQFSEHRVRKTYQAICSCARKIPDEWTVRNRLARLPGKRARYGAVREGGDLAETEFRALERFSGAALVEARPRTGRTHQIRVHLTGAGLPVLGDDLYGGIRASRMMLHATALGFVHPIRKTPMSIRCPLPADFAQCLESLRRSR